MYYKCHNINPNHGGSYADFPEWIKNKKATMFAIRGRWEGINFPSEKM